mgnify:CR=1 FL=1
MTVVLSLVMLSPVVLSLVTLSPVVLSLVTLSPVVLSLVTLLPVVLWQIVSFDFLVDRLRSSIKPTALIIAPRRNEKDKTFQYNSHSLDYFTCR